MRREELLHRRFLLQPIVEVMLGQYIEVCLHVVMSEATELGADNFVPADPGCREVQRNIQPGNKVLLHRQLPHKKGMGNILRVHEQMDSLVRRSIHLRRTHFAPSIQYLYRSNAYTRMCGLM